AWASGGALCGHARSSRAEQRPSERKRARGEPGGGTSALSQIKSRVGISGRIGEAAWHKGVCHAEGLCRSTDEARTSWASERCQEAEGDWAKSAACADSAQGRCRWSELDR